MNRYDLLESYLNGFDELAKIIKETDGNILFYKPSEKKWSIAEIIVHLADAECNGYIRLRKAIAESGCTVDIYDQDAWADKLYYKSQDISNSLALFKLFRVINYQLLSGLSEDKWNNFIMHPQRGKLTLLDVLNMYTEHLYQHINQIKRNITAFNNQIKI